MLDFKEFHPQGNNPIYIEILMYIKRGAVAIIVGEPDVDVLGYKTPGVNTLEYFGIDYKVDFYR